MNKEKEREEEKLNLPHVQRIEHAPKDLNEFPQGNKNIMTNPKIPENILIAKNINVAKEKTQSNEKDFNLKKIEILNINEVNQSNVTPSPKNNQILTTYPSFNQNFEKNMEIRKKLQNYNNQNPLSFPVNNGWNLSPEYSEAEALLKSMNLSENHELKNYIFSLLDNLRGLQNKINILNQELANKDEEIKRNKFQSPNFYNNFQMNQPQFPSANFQNVNNSNPNNHNPNNFNQNSNPYLQSKTDKNIPYRNYHNFPYLGPQNQNYQNFHQAPNPINPSNNLNENVRNHKFPYLKNNLNRKEDSLESFFNPFFPKSEMVNDNKQNSSNNLDIENQFENINNLPLNNFSNEEKKEVKKQEKLDPLFTDSLYAEKLQFEEYKSSNNAHNYHTHSNHEHINPSQPLVIDNNELLQYYPYPLENAEINIPQEDEEIHGLKKYQINKLINQTEIKKKLPNLNIQCNICLQSYDSQRNYCKMNCTHCFHKECISKWLETKAICPICKLKFR